MRRPFFIFLLVLINCILIKCASISDNEENSNKYRNDIGIILNYLNTTPLKIYNYKDAILQSAHQMADVTELTLDVNVECLDKYPELPCDGNRLTCTGFVRQNTVLGDVKCVPKVPQPDLPPPPSPQVPNPQEKSVTLSNEAVSSETTGEHFVAVRREQIPCLGCPIDINPEADGVQELVDLSLKHVESEHVQKHAIIKIHRVQQQVVAGVKYILLIEVAPTVCSKYSPLPVGSCQLDFNVDSRLCEIVFIQQPWISKTKHIIQNNCTKSQEFVETDDDELRIRLPNDIDNEIEANDDLPPIPPTNSKTTKPAFIDTPNFDHLAESGVIYDDTIPPNRLADLESQILFGEPTNLAIPAPPQPPPQQQQQQSQQEIMVEPTEFVVGSSSAINYDQEVVDDRPNNGENTENIDNVEASQSPTTITINDGILMELPAQQQEEINIFDKFAAIYMDLARYENLTNEDESTSSSSSSSTQKTVEESDEEQEENRNSDEVNRFEIPLESTVNTSDTTEKSSQEQEAQSSEENESRMKRAIRQLEKISPEEKGLVRDLADFAANTLDNLDDDNHKRIVLQILGAKKLVADDDGTYYHLILRLGISQCLENGRLNPTENCREKLFENYTKICKVQIYVDVDYTSGPKLIKSQCQNIKRDKNDTNRTNYSRYRRKRRELVGAPQKLDENDGKIAKLLEQGLKQLDSIEGNRNQYKTIEILSATSQVVSGVLYKIQATIILTECDVNTKKSRQECDQLEDAESRTCEFKVWERPWLNDSHQQIDINCDNLDKKLAKRQIGLPGGVFEGKIDDPEVLKHLKNALNRLDSQSESNNRLTIEEIESVHQQIVSGSLWRIRARIVESDCPKSDTTKDLKDCKKRQDADVHICNFKIWSQPWLANGTETNITCDTTTKYNHSYRSKRQIVVDRNRPMPGAPIKTSIDDPKVWEFVTAGLDHLDAENDNANKLKVDQIVSATKQVVAGLRWRITTKITESDCKRNDEKDRRDCGKRDGAESRMCEFDIWDRPWLENGRETTIKCENDERIYKFQSGKRVRRSYEPSSLHKMRNDDDVLNLLMFHDFIEKFNKTYINKHQYQYRFKVFRKNMKYIHMLNTHEQGTAIYGVTKFADLTRKEFSKSLGLRPELRQENEIPFEPALIPEFITEELPTEFDWRNHGVVTEVKDQGQCGSCWAFSVTGNIEGQYALKHKKLLEFSEQELVDCDTNDSGCDGGLMDNAYRAIEKIGGLETEKDYPYDAQDEHCHFNGTLIQARVSGALNISTNETDMTKWLVRNGPISIAINANAMQFYMGGVSHPLRFLCNPKNLDHGVLIVGYGVHTYPMFHRTLPYWIVKNSWGPSWGEQGYYRVYRGDGTCGVNQTPSSAIVV